MTKKPMDRAVAAAVGLVQKSKPKAERTRLLLDVPAWLRETIERESAEQGTSMSQLSAFFLAYALKLYRANDPAMLELLASCKHPIASLRWHFGMDLSEFSGGLTGSALAVDDL